MDAIRIYKEGSNVIVKNDITQLIEYSVPPENWRVETKQEGSVYKIRFYDQQSRLYAFNGQSFAIQDIKNADGISYVTPANPALPSISEVNSLHTKLNLFINTEGYINLSSNYHYISTAGNNEIVLKASATRLVGWNMSNTTGQYRYVKIHDTATAPIQGTTTVKLTISIPPNGSVSFFFQDGIYCESGLAITASTQPQNNSTNDVGANDIIGEIYFT